MNTRIVLTSAIVDLLVEELLLSNTNVCHPYTDVVFNFTINNGKIKEMSVSEYEINDKFNRGHIRSYMNIYPIKKYTCILNGHNINLLKLLQAKLKEIDL